MRFLIMLMVLILAGCGSDDDSFEEVAPVANFVSATHVWCIPANGTITVTFDNPPRDLTVSNGTATVVGKKATITGLFRAGPLALTITWADGTQVLNYTNLGCHHDTNDTTGHG